MDYYSHLSYHNYIRRPAPSSSRQSNRGAKDFGERQAGRQSEVTFFENDIVRPVVTTTPPDSFGQHAVHRMHAITARCEGAADFGQGVFRGVTAFSLDEQGWERSAIGDGSVGSEV